MNERSLRSGYFDTPWQWDKIKTNSHYIALINGDDDPYMPQDQYTAIAMALNATHINIHEGERQQFPELLDYIQTTYLNS